MERIEHNEIFDLAYRFVTETEEPVFLTGKAGTGKTTFLKYLKANCSKNMVVAAPTGVAAIHAGGVTLHSLFQLPLHPFLPTGANKTAFASQMKLDRRRRDLFCKMELLVIDEISMVRCDVMDAIDTVLRSVRKRPHLPMGGVQLLCIGDLYQLPPVARREEWTLLQEYYSSPFFFDSQVIGEQKPLLVELDIIYRQKEGSFIRLLNKIRNNEMEAGDFEDLHRRLCPGFIPPADESYITLTSHNKQADLINELELEKLLAPSRTYPAVTENDFPPNIYPAEAELVLKRGAQVMFLRNDVSGKRYFNGKIGIVKFLEEEKIIVECDGDEISVGQETWENSKYVLNREDGKLEQEIIGTFTQFPLRLAWAITIHKSQGLTFEKVMIDAAAAFSSGQVYVALSRCTGLEGIVLLSGIPPSAIYSNEHVLRGHQDLACKGGLAERFEGARQLFTLQILEDIFSLTTIRDCAGVLASLADPYRDKLNNEGMDWLRELRDNLAHAEELGSRFLAQAAELMRQEPMVENNRFLQDRICSAAGYFKPRLEGYLGSVQHGPIVTEHREVATLIDGSLGRLLSELHRKVYFLQYCSQPFSVTSFLQHKLNLGQPGLAVSCYASGRKQSFSDVSHEELFNTLKDWRDRMVEDTRLPIYMVANLNTLKEIARYLPFTKKDLVKLSGFGRAKAEKYGDDVLEAVRDYCSRHHLESNMEAKEEGQKSKKQGK